jgi:hypothetical protein
MINPQDGHFIVRISGLDLYPDSKPYDSPITSLGIVTVEPDREKRLQLMHLHQFCLKIVEAGY